MKPIKNDKSEQKNKKKDRVRESLKRDRELLKSLFDNIPVLIVIWEPQLKRFTLNKHAEKVLGWTGDDVNTGDLMSLVYPNKAYRSRARNYMKALEPGWSEWICTSKDGTEIPIDWSNFRLSDNTMVGIGVDLREHKQAEKALRMVKEELEYKVHERTALCESKNEDLLKEIEYRKQTETRLRLTQKNLRAMVSEVVLSEEKSRQHFATDLHDTVVQTLGAAKLRSQLIQDNIPDAIKDMYAEIQTLLSEAITQTRSIMAEMSPPVLNELGLIAALEWLAEQIGNQHGIDIRFKSYKKSVSLAREIEVLLFQATRELLMNIVKHAHAKSASVTFFGDQKIRLEVSDNGVGFDTNKTFNPDLKGGYGLYGIRERLRHIGGFMAIKSEFGQGTTVLISAPREIQTP